MISLNWIKDYVDLENEDLNELAEKITKGGVNVEKVINNHIDNLVIGKVLECMPHPDSDHLNVCKVDVGNEILQIVCGADNVRKDLKVIVALPGAVLPGDFEIKKSKVRGIESNGMICALFELGLEENNEENYNKGICELDSDAPEGNDPLKYLGLDDCIYELDSHKRRNNDCYYHIGLAYEIAAVLNKKVKLPDDSTSPIDSNINEYFKLKVETEKCPYYLAKMVTNVKIGESPDFIKKRLTSAGMRPINNVVDISNYVMLEYGQPLHFFDKDKLGDLVVVKEINEPCTFKTLDGKDRLLNTGDIVITDGNKPVCIAGVMGGENTEIDNNTKNILIESAIFDGVSIRNTASRLNLRSEASIRYGKGLNYEYTQKAIDRACHLLEKYASASVLSGLVIHDKVIKSAKIVSFETSEVNKMLGIEISKEDMAKELERLDFEYEVNGDNFKVTIPNRRLDVEANINDIAEEIGRFYGYHNLVSTLPKVDIKKGKYIGDVKYRKLVSFRLRSLGLNECKTYTLVNPNMADLFNYENKENIILPNPMSIDKSVIRTSLIPSLMNVCDYNNARKVENIFLYEIAKTYDKNYNEDTKICVLMKGNYIDNSANCTKVKTDYYLIKGVLENLLDYMGLKNRYSYEIKPISNMHPYMSSVIKLDREEIGIIGRVHPLINKEDIYIFEISLNKIIKQIKPLKFKEAPIYPSIVKDLAFITNKDTSSLEIETVIKKSGGRLLSEIKVFDVYVGDKLEEGKKSIAYSLTFSDPQRTLTDEEVMEVFNKIIIDVTKSNLGVLRDN